MIEAAMQNSVVNPVYETMTKATNGNWTIRVWASAPEFALGPDREILAEIEEWHGMAARLFVHGLIVKFPRIAAIELLDKDGNGGLYYPDWN